MEHLCVTMIGLFLWRLWAYFGLDSIGFVMMILQAISEFFKDIAVIRGEEVK